MLRPYGSTDTRAYEFSIEVGNHIKSTRSKEAAMSEPRTMTAQQVADHVGGRVIGDPEATISDVEVIERATATHLTFLGD